MRESCSRRWATSSATIAFGRKVRRREGEPDGVELSPWCPLRPGGSGRRRDQRLQQRDRVGHLSSGFEGDLGFVDVSKQRPRSVDPPCARGSGNLLLSRRSDQQRPTGMHAPGVPDRCGRRWRGLTDRRDRRPSAQNEAGRGPTGSARIGWHSHRMVGRPERLQHPVAWDRLSDPAARSSRPSRREAVGRGLHGETRDDRDPPGDRGAGELVGAP
jgi:hypothetical protein